MTHEMLQASRRIATRHEKLATDYLAFVHPSVASRLCAHALECGRRAQH